MTAKQERKGTNFSLWLIIGDYKDQNLSKACMIAMYQRNGNFMFLLSFFIYSFVHSFLTHSFIHFLFFPYLSDILLLAGRWNGTFHDYSTNLAQDVEYGKQLTHVQPSFKIWGGGGDLSFI